MVWPFDRLFHRDPLKEAVTSAMRAQAQREAAILTEVALKSTEGETALPPFPNNALTISQVVKERMIERDNKEKALLTQYHQSTISQMVKEKMIERDNKEKAILAKYASSHL